MRQIKFREWLGKEFHYWGFLRDGAFIGPSDPKGIHNQFTGLLDKNGKEIYESDIVKWIDDGQEHTGQVFWDVHAYGFRIQMKMGYMPSFKLLPEHLEVIGNIYANPDLLK